MSHATYRHRFDRVEGYLHHRPPYLMVDEVLRLEQRQAVTALRVSTEAAYIRGHFPGAAVLPGAMMQEMTTQSAGILIAAEHNPMEQFDTEDPFFNEFALGVLVKLYGAKYRGFARPGDRLVATVDLTEQASRIFDFAARIELDGKTILRNRFQLANIESAALIGDEVS